MRLAQIRVLLPPQPKPEGCWTFGTVLMPFLGFFPDFSVF
jgi:hypothetical protein